MTRVSRTAVWIGGLALVVVGLALVTTVIPFGQIIDQQNRVEGTRTELQQLTTQNQILTDEVAVLNTSAEIERMAREKLGYVMPGETAFVVLEPEPTSAPAIAPVAALSTPWWKSIWNFFTGADLRGAATR